MRALLVLLLTSCATANPISGEGTGLGGRASWTTGWDAVDVTGLYDGVSATFVQFGVWSGCVLTAGDDCAMRAENAGRKAIGRAPRSVDE